MAITLVTEIMEARQASADRKGTRSYTRRWRVHSDTPLDGPLTACLAVPVLRFDPYAEPGGLVDFGALAEDIVGVPQSPDDHYRWIVTIRYSSAWWDIFARDSAKPSKPHGSPQNNNSDKDSLINPLNRPPRVSYGMSFGDRYLEQDFSNPPKALSNSAHDKFDPPYMIPEAYPTITVERNEPFFDLDKQVFYSLTINTKTFLNQEPYTVLCYQITGSNEYENGFVYAKVVYEFRIRRKTWKLQALDQGLAYIDPINGDKRAVIDGFGSGYSQPIPLDGTGFPLAIGADPVYLEFQVYDQQDLNELKIII